MEDSNAMDVAAQQAEDELKPMMLVDGRSCVDVAKWWKKWYLKAGHKRLGRVLIKFANESETPTKKEG